MISIKSLTVRYGSTPVLCELNLALAEGQVHGLIGRNGAGKTTLLEAMYGFVRPATGILLFHHAPLRRTDIGYLPAQEFFYPKLTGYEHLAIFRSGQPVFDVEAWNRVFEVPLERLIETYSFGMRKKLALMAVLSLDRPVLILDEPYNGLDLEANQILARLLRGLAATKKTVIVTSHVLGSLTEACDAIHLLANGRVACTFGAREFNTIEARLLGGEAAGKLDLVQRLLRNP